MTKSKTYFTLDFNSRSRANCWIFKPGATLSGLLSGGDVFWSMSGFAFAHTHWVMRLCPFDQWLSSRSHALVDAFMCPSDIAMSEFAHTDKCFKLIALCRLQFWSISGSPSMQCLNQWDFQKGKDVTFCRWFQLFANCKCCFRGGEFEGKLVEPAWKFFSWGTRLDRKRTESCLGKAK